MLLLEASDGVGGRVRTDEVEVRPARARRARAAAQQPCSRPAHATRADARPRLRRPASAPPFRASLIAPGSLDKGFLLDRGFQIFLTSYPEARAALDYEALRLRPFYAGALVRWAGGWHRVADPVRHPTDAAATLLPDNPVGDVADKLRVGWLRCAAARRAGSGSRRLVVPMSHCAMLMR